MYSIVCLLAALLLTSALTLLAWRVASRHRALPCPAWMIWGLENPYMRLVAGADTLLDRLDVRPGMHVLDVGCGPGRVTLPAARRVTASGRVTALDLQTSMVAILEKRLRQSGIGHVEIVCTGIREGVLAPGSVDRALLVTVLGEVPDPAEALRAIHAALKPGGLLGVTEVLPDPHYVPRTRLRRLAEGAGFQTQAEHGSWLAFTITFLKPCP